MKYFLPVIFSIPTVVLSLLFLAGVATGEYLVAYLPEPLKAISLFLPLVGFAACVAITFIKPNDREWKIAAIFNVLPIAFLLAVSIFFWLIGFNGLPTGRVSACDTSLITLLC